MDHYLGRRRLQAVLAMWMASVLLVVAGTGCASHVERDAGESPRFDYRHIELANGLDVITLEDFSSPIVAVQLWYHVGSKDERPDRQGFAHMFEHMMFRGTDRLGPTDHFAFIRRVGGASNGYTSFDRTVYLETLPADQLELALWLEAERMTFLKIDQDAFDIERKVVEEERRMRLNSPYGTLYEKVLAEVFKVHPYRWTPIGKIAHLRATSVSELRDFWKRYYVPSNATLIIVGAVTHAEAQRQAKQYFGWIPRYDEPPRVTVREPEAKGSRSITIKQANAPAPAVAAVYRTVPISHDDSIVLDLLAEILGGGNSSRLYRELVAQKQLAVGAYGGMWSLEQDGVFGLGAMLSPLGGDPKAVHQIIAAHVDRVREEPVSAGELMKAKNQLLRDVVTQNLHIESKARMLGNAAVEIGDVSYVNRQIEDIRKVTAEDIRRVANKYLAADRALKVDVERNLLGMIMGKKKKEPPVTAAREKSAPPPGRADGVRSKDFPDKPPFRKFSAAKITPHYSRQTLDNGLKVLVVPNHEVPFITVQLGLLAGAWTEEKPGTASMTLKMLAKGTSKHTEGQLAEALETYAISLSGNGGMDTSAVSVGCLTEHIGRAMDLLGEVVLLPTFPADEFEKLRKQVRTSLAVSSAKPEYVAEKEFRQRLYGQHPYSRTATGELKDVDALAIDDLKAWWQEYARPDMAVLIIAGDIEPNEAFASAEQTFGKWHRPSARPQTLLPKLAESGKTHIYLVDRPGSIQSQIRIGQRAITRHDEGYFVSRLVSSYFGWGFDSRLNETIRVAKGLTYSVWGSYIAQRFAGEFKIGTFSKTESTADTVRAVLDEIERLKAEGPSEKELDTNRSYILGSFVRKRETPQQIAGDLWLIESQGLSADYLERLLAGIADAKAADCQRLVRRTLRPESLVIVVVGEADKLKDQLKKIGPVTVVRPSLAK